jgi:uncharacterized membrane protein (UPF0127 family)
MPRLLNATRDTVLAGDVRLAESLWDRFWGLMGRKGLADEAGLLIRPCSSVHTAFMRFPIDVVFLDRSLTVVKVSAAVRPFRATIAAGAHSALELNAGVAERAGVEKGDQLVLEQSVDETSAGVDTPERPTDNRSDPH